MNVDLHVHSRLSKTFEFDETNIERLIRMSRWRGLDGFALTEHIHAVGYWGMHEELRHHHAYRDGAYRFDDFTVLSGAEITVAERVDFIVIGPLEQIELLDASFRPRLSEWNHVPALDLLAAVRSLRLISVLAHPFREGKEAAKLDARIYGLIDAVEVNGRDFGGEANVVRLAERELLPLTGGSDAHCFMQVGVRSTAAPGEASYSALRRALRQQDTRVRAKCYAESMVTFCKAVKRAAKAEGAVEAGRRPD